MNDYELTHAVQSNGGAIRAIKSLRARTSCTLKEGFDVVQGFRDSPEGLEQIRKNLVNDAHNQLQQQKDLVSSLASQLRSARAHLRAMLARIESDKSV